MRFGFFSSSNFQSSRGSRNCEVFGNFHCFRPKFNIVIKLVGINEFYFVSGYTAHLTPDEYWTSAYQTLTFHDVIQGLIKPFFFAVVIALVGCYYGLHTRGGTEGVGRSTTQAVVVASVSILVLDFFITKFLIGIRFS